MAVLVLTPNKRDIFRPVMRALATLGIDAEHGTLSGTSSTSLQTPRGTMRSTDAATRDFLKQYEAIFLFERKGVNETTTDTDAALNVWLTWNNTDDPPIVYFAPNLSIARTTLTLPADFPIIRPDPADLANTAALIDAGIFTTGNAPGGGTIYPRLGAGIDLVREGVRVYTPALCAYHSTTNDGYFWRLDTTKQAALGQNGEVLAVPNFPDKSFPANTLAAYRYYNRYFLPLFGEYTTDHLHIGNLSNKGNNTFFWLLYALKLCGIQPARKAILCFEIDHPLITRTGRADGLTEPQQLDILYATYQYLAEFHQRTGLVVPCGVETGGRSGRSSGWHYNYITHANTEIRTRSQAIHALLIKEHYGALPCGIHDHSAQPRDETTSYTRIGDNEHPYAAPNDVPVAPGAGISKRITPTLPDGARDYGDFWDLGPTTTSGTGTTITKPAIWNRYTARMNLYDQVNEMIRMGFPDGYCGGHRYTNCPGNETGGSDWWDTYLELGFRGIRSGRYQASETWRQTHPPTYRYNGLWFVATIGIEWNGSTASVGSYGLYRAGVPSDTHAVGTWSLDVSGDITTDYTTNPATRWKAYRRMIGLSTGLWLRAALFSRGTVFLHPPSWLGADPSNPLAVVDTGSALKLNPMVEMLEAMATIQGVLSDYIRFGSPTDVMNLLDEIGVF